MEEQAQVKSTQNQKRVNYTQKEFFHKFQVRLRLREVIFPRSSDREQKGEFNELKQVSYRQ